ncbi:MAG: hypothetical protein A2Y07_06055 [Planctomycetes bacterium GWF2_50_10]|nr:MAG: hypothetical protein A2Y07_06055 [Planctomycetes bacterium GWF2_50_10]
MVKDVGYIGLGIMGLAMAKNLARAGFKLYVHTRTRSKADELLQGGTTWCESAADVAAKCDVIFVCVTDTPDVGSVLLGPRGVIEAARAGTICIDMSTISPTATARMAQTLSQKNITLLDAPVSGGQIGAVEAKLSIMVGGDKTALEKVRPILEILGRTITYCGPCGSGQKTKLANQVMVVHTVMSMAEGLAFAKKAGLDLQTTYDATSAGAAGSHSLKILGQKVISGDFKPAFMVDLQQKDLRLVLELADELKQPLPGVALIKQLLAVLQAQGRGRDGTQALYDVIRELGSEKN